MALGTTAKVPIRATQAKPGLAKYGKGQLEELWILAGGPKAQAGTAAAVALAESGGNPNAENKNTNGSIDRGLWQINSVHGGLSTTNIEGNVKAAIKINKEQGWSPWTTYKTGAYKGFLAVGAVQEGKLPSGIVGGGGILQEGEHKAEEITAGAWPKFGELGLNLILILAGAALLVYGVMIMVKPRDKAFSIADPRAGLAVG